MKRIILTITILLANAATAMADPYNRARPWTMGGQEDYYRARYSHSYSSGTYRAHPYVQRGYSGYGYSYGYDGYGYRSSGTTYLDTKEGIYVRRDYTLRDIFFGGGDDQVNQTIDISRETRERETEEPKMSTEEMDRWVKEIKSKQKEKEAEAKNENLRQEVEKLELELKKARLEKELKMLQPNDP